MEKTIDLVLMADLRHTRSRRFKSLSERGQNIFFYKHAECFKKIPKIEDVNF